MLDSNLWRHGSTFLTGLALVGAAYLAVQGRWADAAVMAGFVIAAVLFAISRDRLPSLFTFLFALVAAINAAGYAFNLFQTPVWFDEVVHVITPFALVAALAWLLIKRDQVDPVRNPGAYVIRIVLLGIVIGLLWEGFEWLVGIIGTARDTIIDLAMDMLGSILAALFCLLAARSDEIRLKEGRAEPRVERGR